MIKNILGPDTKLCVVGDDDQSIYSWRGADPTNILNFADHFSNPSVILLEENYRCSPEIIKAANLLITHNLTRSPKVLYTKNNEGPPLSYHPSYDSELEAHQVCDHVIHEKHEGLSYKDMAILYRTNAQSRELEEALRRENIPYIIIGGIRFYERQEIKDLIAYLRLLVNPQDSQAFWRVFNTPPRGLGAKAQDVVSSYALLHEISPLEACQLLGPENPKLMKFSNLMQTLQTLYLEHVSITKLFEAIIDLSAYQDYIKKKFPEQYDDKIGNIHELGSAIAAYETRSTAPNLKDWLQDISLQDIDHETDPSSSVTLMTLHAAKGLEFPRVFIVGLEDGILPHMNCLEDPRALEEERRLMYVGITRAKHKISFYSANKRRLYHQWVVNEPSRFLDEIKECLTTPSYPVTENTPDEPHTLEAGDHIIHPAYGKGIILEAEQGLGSIKFVVSFHDYGNRKLAGTHLRRLPSR